VYPTIVCSNFSGVGTLPSTLRTSYTSCLGTESD